MNVLVAYENSLSREFACHHLANSDPGLSIVTAASLEQSISVANGCDQLDVVALDLEMPDMEGLNGLRRFSRQCRHSPVLALMGPDHQAVTVRELIAAGGAGSLPYHLSAAALLGAVRLLQAGERFIPAEMVVGRSGSTGLIVLTNREREVLHGIRAGQSNKEIASDLSLSEVTVKHHIKSLRGKLGARNRAHAVCLADELQLS